MSIRLPSYSPYLNIIGIDPGLNNLGLCSMVVDYLFNVVSIDPITLHPEDPLKNFDPIQYSQAERYSKLRSLQDQLLRHFCLKNPSVVAVEVPFFNETTPSALGSLTEVVDRVRLALTYYDASIPLITFRPKYIKRRLTGKGDADKNDMLAAALSIPELFNTTLVDFRICDNNAVDAVGVAYTQLLHLRENYESFPPTI